jgi:hypothetical protein
MITILFFIVTTISYQIGLYVSKYQDIKKCIKYKEAEIKNSIKLDPEKFAESNFKNGVKLFLKTGYLVPEPHYCDDIENILKRKRFHLKLSPPRSNGWADGWIELKYNGKWYIKII